MPKVLAQAGISLADIYDVKGSVVGVETLLSQEVSLTHEMGATVFSERIVGTIQRMTSVALAQNITFDVTLPIENLPEGIYRILGVYCQGDVAGRIEIIQVSVRSVALAREIPIFIWDTNNDIQSTIRILEDGAAIGNDTALIQANPSVVPTLGISRGQRLRVGDELVMRGLTSAFGAGTVVPVALVYLAFSETTSISSTGLPIPGW